MVKEGCGTSHGVRVWCNSDVCGVVCAFVTWALIFYAQYVVNKIVIIDWMGLFSFWGVLNFLCFNGVAGLATVSHVRAMMTDPGAVPREATPLPEDDDAAAGGLEEGNGGDGLGGSDGKRRVRKYCRRCNAFKPPRAHHCSICRRCIIKMDHHCPWVNNCVGIGNHKLFLLFVLYIFLMCTYALLLVVARYAGCLHGEAEDDEARCGDAAGNLLVIFLVIEAVLFGLFTCCMMLDQYTVVSTNTTAIDRLKGEYHKLSRAATHEVNEVFGGKDRRFRLDWFLPVPVAFPRSLAFDILGYRLDHDDHETGRALHHHDEEDGILMVNRDRDRRRSLDHVGSVGVAAVGAVAAGGGVVKSPLLAGSSLVPGAPTGAVVSRGERGAASRQQAATSTVEDEPVEIGSRVATV